MKTYLSKASLSFNNARDLYLPAQGWKPHNKLNWIHIMSDDNKLGLFWRKKKKIQINIVYTCCDESVAFY